MTEPRFQRFVYTDLKYLLQLVNNPEYLTEFSKFLIFFKVDEDPELVELLCDQVCKRVKDFTVDEHLTILTNLAHTLNPAYEDVF